MYYGVYGNPPNQSHVSTWCFRSKPLRNGFFLMGAHKVFIKGSKVTVDGNTINLDAYMCISFDPSRGFMELFTSGKEAIDWIGRFRNLLRKNKDSSIFGV